MNWTDFFTLGVFCATFHWILARAQITRFFWELAWLPPSRFRNFLDSLFRCAGCSGFWLGLVGAHMSIQPWPTQYIIINYIITGLLGVFVTPIFEAVFLWGLDKTNIVQL